MKKKKKPTFATRVSALLLLCCSFCGANCCCWIMLGMISGPRSRERWRWRDASGIAEESLWWRCMRGSSEPVTNCENLQTNLHVLHTVSIRFTQYGFIFAMVLDTAPSRFHNGLCLRPFDNIFFTSEILCRYKQRMLFRLQNVSRLIDEGEFIVLLQQHQ